MNTEAEPAKFSAAPPLELSVGVRESVVPEAV